MKLLDMVGLRDSAGKKAAAYSKGMKQRLVFIRALINNPGILFLDEPTSGLDPSTAGRIKEIILQKKREGCTVFLTTHNMAAADEMCDRVAFLNEGGIAAMDTPRNLKLKYGDKSVRVEYRENGRTLDKVLFPAKADDKRQLNDIISNKEIETIHSQEATLEQIFIQLTGRGLE